MHFNGFLESPDLREKIFENGHEKIRTNLEKNRKNQFCYFPLKWPSSFAQLQKVGLHRQVPIL